MNDLSDPVNDAFFAYREGEDLERPIHINRIGSYTQEMREQSLRRMERFGESDEDNSFHTAEYYDDEAQVEEIFRDAA